MKKQLLPLSFSLLLLVGGITTAHAQKASAQRAAADQSASMAYPYYPCTGINGTLSASTDNGPVGNVATANSYAAAEVDIYTPVTITANGNRVATYVWEAIYSSAGPNSYSSSASGNQLYITPLEPQSLYAPNGTMNGDQFYALGCTMTSQCASIPSEYIGYGLYSIPPGGSPTGYRAAPVVVDAYPNPADQQFIITTAKSETAVASLYDQYGMLRKSMTVSGLLVVPTQDLKPGMYLLRVKSRNGKAVEKKINIQH